MVGALVIYQLVENSILAQAVYHGTVKLAHHDRSQPRDRRRAGRNGGALMAIPIAGAIKVVLEEVLAWRRGSDTRFAS